MSDLQLSLLGLGAVLVAGVWTYNKLQERKYRQAAEKVFRSEQPDVLVAEHEGAIEAEPVQEEAMFQPEPAEEYPHQPQNERREPVFDSEPESFESESESAFLPQEEIPVAVAPTASGHAMPPPEWCDESTDLVARLYFDAGIPAADLRQAQSAMQAHQRVHLRVFVETERGWMPLAEAGESVCANVWFALQLVDRRGAVSTNDFEALRHSLQALASLRDGSLVFPDVAALGEQARALDEFCAQLDLQLAVNVLDAGQGAFPGTKIRGMAEAAGMQLTSKGEFQACDENGNFMYALANMGEPFDAETMKNLQTHGLTFLLDVPHVRDGGRAFERMLSSARQFANTLDATLVNAQRAPISDAMVDSIRKKIFEIHEQMNLAGIPAGGMRALRLFS